MRNLNWKQCPDCNGRLEHDGEFGEMLCVDCQAIWLIDEPLEGDESLEGKASPQAHALDLPAANRGM